MTFATAVPILFTSCVYRTNVYWSVIHGIKRKPHLSVVWNWYHFVTIAILHQPRPTDSADINRWLQLSDTSSIPPMHGGFLLISIHGTLYQQNNDTKICMVWTSLFYFDVIPFTEYRYLHHVIYGVVIFVLFSIFAAAAMLRYERSGRNRQQNCWQPSLLNLFTLSIPENQITVAFYLGYRFITYYYV